MARMAELLCVDNPPLVNDCIICDTSERAKAEGRTSFSVSTSGQPLCADCNYFVMMERMD
jgi:hypothetical protein